MDEIADQSKVSRTITYDTPESAVVFRIAWYVVASQPGVLLTEYSEAESTSFMGNAKFSADIDSTKIATSISVEEAQTSVEISVFGNDEASMSSYVDTLTQYLETSLHKYRQLEDDDTGRLRLALVAKTCWDRVIHYILEKGKVTDIYFQVAHGREMMIKATEGDDIHPVTLSTSGWLSTIEKLPREESLPADLATNLAKKSIEWKRETHLVIEKYLELQP
ncbi:MAG: hypothetical protein RTU92_06590 [Candidatus Thorarchaeota archaeon]